MTVTIIRATCDSSSCGCNGGGRISAIVRVITIEQNNLSEFTLGIKTECCTSARIRRGWRV
eukprot:CAMPEP_0174973896 /NCGR_PEP_ID=MMETSP0004_2-20121128/11511_1 /TAXON_ID=420556 /ORGANISM="Ochromonas sp., Strain CCMP1393" /LENGTH=60 /DNA_ID=CAMNT_0016224425 /DNA_START=373 /DNA_END=555 /DNA_ORIENTATION=-